MKGSPLDNSIQLKICDMGNVYWITYYFSRTIQKRQYSSLELFLWIKLKCKRRYFVIACVVFELSTGDYLFSSRKGESYNKNDEHIAKFIRMLAKMRKHFVKWDV